MYTQTKCNLIPNVFGQHIYTLQQPQPTGLVERAAGKVQSCLLLSYCIGLVMYELQVTVIVFITVLYSCV